MTGPVGRAMLAVKEAPTAAEAMGVNVARLEAVVFAVAAMIAGVGGSMYAYAIGYITPDSFALHLTVLFVAASIVGGARSVVGAILGAAVVMLIPVIATDINPALSSVIFGTALVVSVMLMPVGIAGAVRWLRRTPAVASVDGSSAGRSEEALLVGDATVHDAVPPPAR